MRNGSSVPLRVRRLGLHTQKQAVAVMRTDCPACQSVGLTARSHVLVRAGEKSIQAELFQLLAAGNLTELSRRELPAADISLAHDHWLAG